MRVTHVITRLIVGGAQENTIATVLGLRQKPGVHIDLISGPSPGPEGSLESRVSQACDFTRLPSLVRPIDPWKDCAAFRQLAAIFRKQRPDIVHTHSGKAGFLGRLAASKADVPVIIHTIHGPSFGPFQGPVANLVFKAAERRAGKITTHFIVVADAMKAAYLKAGIGRSHQYTRILSGFDLAPFRAASDDPALRQQFGFGPDDIVVGKVARLFKLKGHDDLFRIAGRLLAECPRLRFLLIGDGPWRSRFEGLARQFPGAFAFTGLVAPEHVPRLIGITDIVVHLSFREGLPRALPQALAAGKPVVAYDCDGAGEACLDGKTGFLIGPGDLETLAKQIVRLADDRDLRLRLGREGKEFASSRFEATRMVEEIHQLYLRLLKGKESAVT